MFATIAILSESVVFVSLFVFLQFSKQDRVQRLESIVQVAFVTVVLVTVLVIAGTDPRIPAWAIKTAIGLFIIPEAVALYRKDRRTPKQGRRLMVRTIGRTRNSSGRTA
ncbi:MAG: hypothetical protein HYR70_04425 [Chloroflexi bacterium]|nr:hypothetical protein [Chloroflexota bacterium]MBI3340802.1 hypothetical protein [Chloroflexota bacterium]